MIKFCVPLLFACLLSSAALAATPKAAEDPNGTVEASTAPVPKVRPAPAKKDAVGKTTLKKVKPSPKAGAKKRALKPSKSRNVKAKKR